MHASAAAAAAAAGCTVRLQTKEQSRYELQQQCPKVHQFNGSQVPAAGSSACSFVQHVPHRSPERQESCWSQLRLFCTPLKKASREEAPAKSWRHVLFGSLKMPALLGSCHAFAVAALRSVQLSLVWPFQG